MASSANVRGTNPASKPAVKGIRERIQHFPPSWFAITMGTGVVSSLLHAFPYGNGSIVLRGFALAFAALNLCLFITFSVMSMARYAMFPDVWRLMVLHPVQSLYLSCVPMGFGTLIVSGALLEREYSIGKSWVYVLWTAWWIDIVFSVLVCLGLLHIMITRHRHSIEQATAAWLLPVVAPVVASSVGHIVADVLAPHSQSHALLTSTVSVCLVLLGLGLVFMMLPLYLFRLVTHGLPASGLIISCFLPLGPCGQGGYSLLLAADLFPLLLRGTASPFFRDESAFAALRIVLLTGAFCLWTLGTMWLVMACAAVCEIAARNRLTFALPWWGVVFPNGVYTLLTLQLGRALDSTFFTNFGAGWAVVTMTLWVLLAIPTVRYAFEGSIFHAPCLSQAELGVTAPQTPAPP